MKKRIAILTGGGDAPGLNPAIKWAVKKALSLDYEVYGIVDGWNGMLQAGDLPQGDLYNIIQEKLEGSAQNLIKKGVHEFTWRDLATSANLLIAPLSEKDVSKWDEHPGTNLGSSRVNPFKEDNDRSKQLLESIEALGIDYLITMGGEDTLGAGNKAAKLGIGVVGVPKTIDGDLLGTDYSLGFRTAVGVIRNSVLTLHGTAKSHDQTTIMETMGRHSGLLAYTGGVVSAADMILIPEFNPSIEKMAEILDRRKSKGSKYDIVVVSEGTKIADYDGLVAGNGKDEFGHEKLGGIGERIKTDLEKITSQKIRCTSLGYLQRGQIPVAYDVEMGRRFGIAAVELIEKNISGRMISYRDGKITHTSLEEVSTGTKSVHVETMYDKERLNAKLTGFGF